MATPYMSILEFIKWFIGTTIAALAVLIAYLQYRQSAQKNDRSGIKDQKGRPTQKWIVFSGILGALFLVGLILYIIWPLFPHKTVPLPDLNACPEVQLSLVSNPTVGGIIRALNEIRNNNQESQWRLISLSMRHIVDEGHKRIQGNLNEIIMKDHLSPIERRKLNDCIEARERSGKDKPQVDRVHYLSIVEYPISDVTIHLTLNSRIDALMGVLIVNQDGYIIENFERIDKKICKDGRYSTERVAHLLVVIYPLTDQAFRIISNVNFEKLVTVKVAEAGGCREI